MVCHHQVVGRGAAEAESQPFRPLGEGGAVRHVDRERREHNLVSNQLWPVGLGPHGLFQYDGGLIPARRSVRFPPVRLGRHVHHAAHSAFRHVVVPQAQSAARQLDYKQTVPFGDDVRPGRLLGGRLQPLSWHVGQRRHGPARIHLFDLDGATGQPYAVRNDIRDELLVGR